MKKQSLLLTTMALFGFTMVFGQTPQVLEPTHDTWVRSNNASWKGTSNATLEMKSYDDGAGNVQNFYGLLSFTIAEPESGYEVKSATLRLTTRVPRGERTINIYALTSTISESSTSYSTIGSDIETAIAGEPLATFDMKGQGNKALTDNGLSSDYLTIEAWQNTIDLTTYVKTMEGNTLTLLLQKPQNNNNTSIVYSKEQGDATWNTGIADIGGTTIPASELHPQLTIEYQEKTGGEVVEPTQKRSVESQPAHDTWVRSNNTSWKGTSAATLEMKSYDDGAGNVQNFYGLLSFNIEAPAEDEEVTSAVLRLTTRVPRGERTINIYALTSTISEGSTSYSTIGSDIETAIAGEPLATFDMKGQGNKALTDNGLSSDYLTIEAWQNTIDLTTYVKTMEGNTLTLLLQKPQNNNSTSIVYSKEQGDATWNTGIADIGGTTIPASELTPLLKVTYEHKGETTGISSMNVEHSTLNIEHYYDLQGRRVNQPQKGLYIVNGKKVIF